MERRFRYKRTARGKGGTRRRREAGSGPTVKGPRPRLLRDPIHGDIAVSPLEAAIIDTRMFQRLRYIRQNGLLHFIFPGAVHTRFGHCIGTMAIAERVFTRLFAPLASEIKSASLRYVKNVFRLAALLHDVGHCAFSHSSERVSVDGKPLLGTLAQRLEDWKDKQLLDQLTKHIRIAQTDPQCMNSLDSHLSAVFSTRPPSKKCALKTSEYRLRMLRWMCVR